MAELVDALVSNTCALTGMPVRLRLRVQNWKSLKESESFWKFRQKSERKGHFGDLFFFHKRTKDYENFTDDINPRVIYCKFGT